MTGGLAQLVERLLCKQDVSGSSPLTSIQRNPRPTRAESFVCGRPKSRKEKPVRAEQRLQPPFILTGITRSMIERKLDSPGSMVARASVGPGCSAKNLDNCIGKSGNKASHGCLIAKMLFATVQAKASGILRSSKNSMGLEPRAANSFHCRRGKGSLMV